MSEKKDVIRRLKMGQSIRTINRETGIHRTIIRNIKRIADQKDWLGDNRELPDEEEIKDELGTSSAGKSAGHELDKYEDEIKLWLKEKTSFLIIHDHLKERGVSCSETTVRRYIHKTFPRSAEDRATMLRETIPGEILEVDFGYMGLVYEAVEGRNRKCWVFSARLRHSKSAWREVCLDQTQQTFFRCLIHAFEYFGGITVKVVPDNLKAAVVKASFEEPVINRIFQLMAIHYGFLISPTLPRTPEHKGGVENDVKYIKGNFLPRYRESERQKGHDVPHWEGMQKALEKWNDEVADVRTVKGIGRRPVDIFHNEEKAALKPLPDNRWDIVSWASAKVQDSWRIQFDRSFYSVPYQYIGRKVTVLADSYDVFIYLEEKEIAKHTRAVKNWTYRRETHHAPPHQEEFLKLTKGGLLRWASGIGPNTERVCLSLFNQKGVDGLQPVRSLLHLSKKYSRQRLENACERILIYDDNPRYGAVKNILVRRLDMEPIDSPPKFQVQTFRFQREFDFSFEGMRDREVANG